MKKGHIAAALPAAVSYGWTVGGFYGDPVDGGSAGAGLIVGLVCGLAVMAVCTAPDWDHPNYQNRMHVGAAVVRWSARLAYRIRTPKDRERTDEHRGPSHSLEAALLVGLLVALVLNISPHTTGPLAWWIGLGVTIGWADHVFVDAMTPSGVPLCATYNYFVHGEVWRRHAFSWRWRGIWPVLTMIPVDESRPGCRPGLFLTDSGAEHLLVIPGFYLLTGGIVVVRAGLAAAVVSVATGIPL